MDKKRLLGLILFAMIIITGLFVSTNYLINKNSSNAQYNDGATAIEDTSSINSDKDQKDPVGMANEEENPIIPSDTMGDIEDADKDIPKDFVSKKNELNIPDNNGSVGLDLEQSEPWLSSNPTDIGNGIESTTSVPKSSSNSETNVNNSLGVNEVNTSVSNRVSAPELIYDCTTVDYMSYVPAIMSDSTLEQVLNIKNPNIDIDAEAAILIDTETKEVLYHKNPIEAEFPASTAKLLTALVALEWCTEEEDVTIGDEISMIASDSTRAYLLKGQVLTVRNILEGMLLPSGNDAAYAIAAYVGKKSQNDFSITKEEAVARFIDMMNEKARALGVKNSVFKTPDGYDAIGQYTTAYDMGLIGCAAANNETIIDITQKSKSRNIFVSGEDVTWNSTNKLISQYSGQYFPPAIGLKTGTSTMAGRCLVAAAEKDGKKVVCVIMDSSAAGRWEDAIVLLKYGLE